MSTVRRRLVSISQAHKLAGYESPTAHGVVRDVLKGLCRERGSTQKAKDAVGTNELRAMVGSCDNSLQGMRDKALLLFGFVGAFRRSELVAITMADIDLVAEEGLRVHIRKSKTDQEGEGRLVGIPYGQHAETCPVLATRAWLDAAQINGGTIFRAVDRHGRIAAAPLSGRAVALVIQRRAAAVGLDPKRFAAHSLRSGFCTAAAAKDVSERLIMLQTGHKSVQMVRKYIRQGSIFSQNAAKSLDL